MIAHRNTALGNPELVDGKTSYLAGTAEEFVDRIRRVIRNPDETRMIVEAAYRSLIEHFRPDRATAPIIAAIEHTAMHA